MIDHPKDCTVYSSTKEDYYEHEAVPCDFCGALKPLYRIKAGYWQSREGHRLTFACRSCITEGRSWYDHVSNYASANLTLREDGAA